MNLKRVKIFGFKTFADRTEFELTGGLAAVVGSNGCGKSNLVDAILWGLGEGNSRQLRASSGTEVIFNGSSSRKKLSFAEVQITFDNEDHELPAPTSEVVISRRVSAGGDSEFRINHTQCRLRDIHELLADSGLGRSGYAIVGQREIDSALSATAEERRAWVDEAAGVQRYRQRKLESLRRLEAANGHLQRTKDIIGELELQREPLRAEAETARSYKRINDALQSLELGLLRRDWVETSRQIEVIEQSRTKQTRLLEETKNQEVQYDRKVARSTQEIEQIDLVLERDRGAMAKVRHESEQNGGDQRLLQQKIESLIQLETELNSGGVDSQVKVDGAGAELESARIELEADRAQLEAFLSSSESLGQESKAVRAELAQVEARIREAKQAEEKRLKLAIEQQNRKARLVEIRREIDGIDASQSDLLEGLEEGERVASEAKTKVETIEIKMAQLEQLAEAAKKESHEFDLDRRNKLQQAGLISGKIQGAEMSIHAHEGLSHGAKSVLDAVRSGQLKGDFVAVGDAIETRPEYGLAIETALGGAVNDLIVESDHEAKTAIEWLKAGKRGRVTFQPINLARKVEVRQDLLELLHEPGVVGLASELIETSAEHRNIMLNLLARVVVIEEVASGLRLLKKGNRPFSRLVTLGGEVLHQSGAMTGGSGSYNAVGLVQRKAEVSNLQKQLKGLESDINGLETKMAQSESSLQHSLLERESCKPELGVAQSEYKEANDFLNSLRHESTSTGKEKDRLLRERQHLEIGDNKVPEKADTSSLESEHRKLIERLAQSSAQAEEFESRAGELRQRVSQSDTRFVSAQRRVEMAYADEQKRKKRLEEIKPELDRFNHQLEKLKSEGIDLGSRVQGLEKSLADQSQLRLEIQESMRQSRDAQQQIRVQLEALTESSHRLEIDHARFEAKRANVMQRLVEEFDLLESQILAWSDFDPVEKDSERLASQFKRELKAMGDVNLGAIEAFDRLSQRYDELQVQVDDIEAGIIEVQLAIIELDGKTKDQFLSTLLKVQTHFKVFLTRLFDGGEGEIALTDPANPLDSGIELAVTLPGKRRQALGLLSGGERSLCAMAFLFSLLETKTSPLVILDEVDAPLDGHNLDRYVSLLQEYATKSQVIVITHNPNTIAACPVWLGVTMKEPGVSSIIPYRSADAMSKNGTNSKSQASLMARSN